MAYLIRCLSLLVSFAAAQSTFSPARPPAIPLAVRSPYLSTWQPAGSDGGNGGYLAGQWPSFWNGAVTGWTGLIRIDNITYTFLGDPKPLPTVMNQTSFSYTSTRSIFALEGGGITMNVTFLSPVTPTDLLRQSFPITYMSVEVQSSDGNKHDVQLYTDVSAEWTSGDRSQLAQWSYDTVQGNSAGSSFKKRGAEAEPPWWHGGGWKGWGGDGGPDHWHRRPFQPGNEPASTDTTSTSTITKRISNSATTAATSSGGDGAAVGVSTSVVSAASASASIKTTPISSAATSATGTDSAGGIAYHKFWRQNQQEFTEDNQQAAWGFWYYATQSSDGLTHQSGADVDVRGQFTSSGVLNNTEDTNYRAINDDYPVFGFALDLGSIGPDSVESLFTINLAQDPVIQFEGAAGVQSIPSYWSSTYSDYEAALSFFFHDYENVATITSNLDDQIASDSTAVGGSDYATLTSLAVRQAFGALQVSGNSSDHYIFLKEISSDGDIQTVDVIFPAIPIILYLNAEWMKLLLDPLFIYQEAGLFTQGDYAMHDLGIYPNATGAGDEKQPLEECGNMLIMTLAYAQKTGDTEYLSQHYTMLNKWTQYLVNDSLYPDNQISTDDFAGSLANQTNLALKGMIGIQAMAVIANMTGHTSDGANYTNIAQSYIAQWQNLGIVQNATAPHTILAYGMENTHGLLYNLYGDALLQTNLVPTSVYQMQSDFYPTVDNTYGVPLDSRHTYTKSDWELFCAAIADSTTADMFISEIATWINATQTDGPASDLYETTSGDYAINITHFTARPVVGGWFSLLALNETGIPSNNGS